MTRTGSKEINHHELHIDDEVMVTGARATIKYIGQPSFARGIWIGVALNQPKGKNDGSVQGVRYFQCPANHGMFVRRSMVRLAPPSSTSINDSVSKKIPLKIKPTEPIQTNVAVETQKITQNIQHCSDKTVLRRASIEHREDVSASLLQCQTSILSCIENCEYLLHIYLNTSESLLSSLDTANACQRPIILTLLKCISCTIEATHTTITQLNHYFPEHSHLHLQLVDNKRLNLLLNEVYTVCVDVCDQHTLLEQELEQELDTLKAHTDAMTLTLKNERQLHADDIAQHKLESYRLRQRYLQSIQSPSYKQHTVRQDFCNDILRLKLSLSEAESELTNMRVQFLKSCIPILPDTVSMLPDLIPQLMTISFRCRCLNYYFHNCLESSSIDSFSTALSIVYGTLLTDLQLQSDTALSYLHTLDISSYSCVGSFSDHFAHINSLLISLISCIIHNTKSEDSHALDLASNVRNLSVFLRNRFGEDFTLHVKELLDTPSAITVAFKLRFFCVALCRHFYLEYTCLEDCNDLVDECRNMVDVSLSLLQDCRDKMMYSLVGADVRHVFSLLQSVRDDTKLSHNLPLISKSIAALVPLASHQPVQSQLAPLFAAHVQSTLAAPLHAEKALDNMTKQLECAQLKIKTAENSAAKAHQHRRSVQAHISDLHERLLASSKELDGLKHEQEQNKNTKKLVDANSTTGKDSSVSIVNESVVVKTYRRALLSVMRRNSHLAVSNCRLSLSSTVVLNETSSIKREHVEPSPLLQAIEHVINASQVPLLGSAEVERPQVLRCDPKARHRRTLEDSNDASHHTLSSDLVKLSQYSIFVRQ